jgi:hypothetical protein
MIKIALISLFYVFFVSMASGQKDQSQPAAGDRVPSAINDRA